MKKIILMAMTALLIISCSSKKSIDFTEAENYFVNNNVTGEAPAAITSQDDFNKYFGMAATMSPDGNPTAIDFSKQFVITKVLPVTSKETEIEPVSVTKNGNQLVVEYTVKEGEEMSYSICPFFAIILAKEYAELPVTFQEKSL